MGSSKANIQRCTDFCSKVSYGTCCFDSKSYKTGKCPNGRGGWCADQQKALETICKTNLLDANQVSIANDYGMGAAQSQPTTWIGYDTLKNKNPWNLDGAIFAMGLKLTDPKNNVNLNERGALVAYNGLDDYPDIVLPLATDWETNYFSRVAILYGCKSANDDTCILNSLSDISKSCDSKVCISQNIQQKSEDKIKILQEQLNNLQKQLVASEVQKINMSVPTVLPSAPVHLLY